MAKASSRGGQRTIPSPFTEVNDKLWWNHRKYAPEELQKIDGYLQEVLKDPHFTSDLYANLKTLYKGLGLHPHPFLNYPLKKTLAPDVLANLQQQIAQAEAANAAAKKGAPQVEKPEIPECEMMQINNIKLDTVVLKLIAFCWGQSKLTTLKFTRNEMDGPIEEQLIDIVSNPTFKLNKLFIDWNPATNFNLYTKILNNPNIQSLSLRCNLISDSNLGTLCAALKDNISLKSLDLYGNNITAAGIAHIAGLIETSCCLEYIGLGKNRLGKWSDVKDWLDNLGKFSMTTEEVEEYRQKEKDKEAAILKNQKNRGKKGYVEDPVPYLYPIAQGSDGIWYMLKAIKIRLINLALNNFDSDSLPGFNNLLSRQDDDFCLILSNNPINKIDIQPLQLKHKNKLIF